MLPLRQLGPFTVSPVGLGCMSLSHAYATPPSARDAEALLRCALDLGVTHFDTAALYGFGDNESLLGRTLSAHRQQFTLASKCGMQGVVDSSGVRRVIDGRPTTIKQTCEDSLRRLKTETIDLYYLHRWDKTIAIEESVGALAELQREGKIRSVGLSEVSAQTLLRAHAVTPIAAVQSEYSLWTREPEIAVLAACRSIRASFVAFSPLGRGFLGGELLDVSALESKDLRRTMPRFSSENYPRNLALLLELKAVASMLNIGMAQVALGWLLGRGDHIVAIPGTTSLAHLHQNCRMDPAALPTEAIHRLDQAINERSVCGNRYSAATQLEVDTEQF